MSRFISFKLGEQICGIDVLMVREVNQIRDHTPVQLAPVYIHGLINLRGQIVTIVDLARRIEYASDQKDCEKYNIILKSGQEISAMPDLSLGLVPPEITDTIGLRVDAIGDVIDTYDQLLEGPPANISDFNARFVGGVYNLPLEPLLVLNLNTILKFEAP